MRRLAMFLVAAMATMVAGTGVLTPNAASAVSCPTSGGGYICWFENSNGTGLLESTRVSLIERSRCRTLGTYSTNRTSYIKNTSAELFHVYNGTTCSDTPGTIWPNSEGPMNSTWNDVISSYFKA